MSARLRIWPKQIEEHRPIQSKPARVTCKACRSRPSRTPAKTALCRLLYWFMWGGDMMCGALIREVALSDNSELRAYAFRDRCWPHGTALQQAASVLRISTRRLAHFELRASRQIAAQLGRTSANRRKMNAHAISCKRLPARATARSGAPRSASARFGSALPSSRASALLQLAHPGT